MRAVDEYSARFPSPAFVDRTRDRVDIDRFDSLEAVRIMNMRFVFSTKILDLIGGSVTDVLDT